MPQTFADKLEAHLSHTFNIDSTDIRCQATLREFRDAFNRGGVWEVAEKAQSMLNSMGPSLEQSGGDEAQQRNLTRRLCAEAVYVSVNTPR